MLRDRFGKDRFSRDRLRGHPAPWLWAAVLVPLVAEFIARSRDWKFLACCLLLSLYCLGRGFVALRRRRARLEELRQSRENLP